MNLVADRMFDLGLHRISLSLDGILNENCHGNELQRENVARTKTSALLATISS
jgi:hypothetical protein